MHGGGEGREGEGLHAALIPPARIKLPVCAVTYASICFCKCFSVHAINDQPAIAKCRVTSLVRRGP